MISLQAFPGQPTGFMLGLLTATFALLALAITGRWKVPPRCPKGIRWSGRRTEIFSKIRASYRGWPSMLPNLSEGYHKYTAHGEPYIHPNASLRPQVILPARELDWMIRQPDSKLSPHEVMNDSMGVAHLFFARDAKVEKIAAAAISQHLTQRTDLIQEDLYNELQSTLDQILGTDTRNWKSVALFPAMERVVSRTTGRLLFGPELSRNEGYLRALSRCCHYSGVSMLFSGQLFPWFLQPVLSVFFKVPLHFAIMIYSSYTEPLITSWLARIDLERRMPSSSGSALEVPYNLATSFLRAARKLTGSERTARQLTSWINTFAILPFSTLPISACTVFLELASYPKTRSLAESLRQEATETLASEAAWKNPASFKALQQTDSAIMESLRLNPIMLRLPNREVIHPDGLTLPTGHHLPRGTWVATSALDVNLDERLYADPMRYDPSRFLSKDGCNPVDDSPNIPRVPGTSTMVSFGAGRHACPGRHFSLHVLKMIVAYVVTYYEIDPLDKKPRSSVYGDVHLPDPTATIRVRRRDNV
ncbi:cytochrome P450 [Aspergillus californicus]